jgi:hypothetical protein
MAVEWIASLTNPLNEFLNSAITFFPSLVVSVILLAIGWIVGSIVGRIIKELMLRFKIDQYLSKRGPSIKISDIFPIIFEWVIYLVFIQSAVSVLGIEPLTEFVGEIISFIPGLVEAVIVVIVGYVLAEYVKNEIEKSKIAYSRFMAAVMFWLLVYVAIALALPLVNIDATLVNNMLLVAVGSIGIGVAIALGLGLKELVAAWARAQAKRMGGRKR